MHLNNIKRLFLKYLPSFYDVVQANRFCKTGRVYRVSAIVFITTVLVSFLKLIRVKVQYYQFQEFHPYSDQHGFR